MVSLLAEVARAASCGSANSAACAHMPELSRVCSLSEAGTRSHARLPTPHLASQLSLPPKPWALPYPTLMPHPATEQAPTSSACAHVHATPGSLASPACAACLHAARQRAQQAPTYEGRCARSPAPHPAAPAVSAACACHGTRPTSGAKPASFHLNGPSQRALCSAMPMPVAMPVPRAVHQCVRFSESHRSTSRPTVCASQGRTWPLHTSGKHFSSRRVPRYFYADAVVDRE